MFNRNLCIIILTMPLLGGCVAAVATGALVGTDMANSRRTSGIYIEDQSIELKTRDVISKNSELNEASSISVTSFNRIVLLVGQAPTQQYIDQASEIARGVANVRKVHNEIRLSAPDSFLSATSDSWLTTKAKSLLLSEKHLSSTHIKVVTENGELFLMGLVTRAEADKAIAVARGIDGVERVIQVFEYIH